MLPQTMPERSVSRHATVTHRSKPPLSSPIPTSPPAPTNPHQPTTSHPHVPTSNHVPTPFSSPRPSQATASPPPSRTTTSSPSPAKRSYTAKQAYSKKYATIPRLLNLSPSWGFLSTTRSSGLSGIVYVLPPEEPSNFPRTLLPHLRYQSAPSLLQATPSPPNPTVPLT